MKTKTLHRPFFPRWSATCYRPRSAGSTSTGPTPPCRFPGRGGRSGQSGSAGNRPQSERPTTVAFSAARADARIQRDLDETGHNRWIAARALMGYRTPRLDSGEKRDDDFRYHFDLVPFSELPSNEVGKDELSICCIPLFMALEGIRLERKEEKA